MANVTADIRIFPNKELFSVDMAEVLDAGILRSGVIQGCSISETNGVLNIDSGRIAIRGRLGVVTGGVIPLPSISVESSCTVLAVCDLRNNQQPFYIEMVDSAGLDALIAARTTDGTFNVGDGLDFVVLGTVIANPSTGLVSNWVAAEGATAMKGPDIYEAMRKDFLKDYMIRKAFNTGAHSAASGTGTINYTYTIPNAEIPTGYKPFDVRLTTNGGGDGWWEFYNCSCDFADYPTNKNVALRFQRRSGTGGTLYPWIVVTFVKDIT